MWMIVAPVPVPSRTTPRSAPRWRSGARTTDSAGTRRAPAGRTTGPAARPVRPATASRRSGAASRTAATGRVARSGPRARPCPGITSTAAAASRRPGLRGELRHRSLRAVGSVKPQRDPAGEAEQGKAAEHVDVAAAERGHPEQRHQRADVEHRAQRVGGGAKSRYTGIATSPTTEAITNATDTARSPRLGHAGAARPGDRRCGTRTGRSRLITDRNITQRVTSEVRRGGRPRDAGDREPRRGPGLGPTA